MKKNLLGLVTIITASVLTIGVIGMVGNLTLQHLNNQKSVIVSYPCIVVKGERWIRTAELQMRNYVIPQSSIERADAEKAADGNSIGSSTKQSGEAG